MRRPVLIVALAGCAYEPTPLTRCPGDCVPADSAPGDPAWYGLGGSALYPFGPQQSAGAATTTSACYEYDGPHRDAPGAGSGGVSNTNGCSEVPAIVATPEGDLVVTWHDASTGNWEAYGRILDAGGDTWREMDGSATELGISEYGDTDANGTTGFPDAAVTGAGKVLVAWHDDVGASFFRIFLRRFDPLRNSWEALGSSADVGTGGVSANARPSHRPRVAEGPGDIVVAWEDRADRLRREVFLKRFDAGVWQEVAGSATPGTFVAAGEGGECARVAIDARGRIMVVWRRTGNTRILGKRTTEGRDGWEGVAGSAAVGISGGPGTVTCPALAIDPNDDAPVVAWVLSHQAQHELRVARPGPGGWALLGAGPVARGFEPMCAPSVVIAGGAPVVAWQQEVAGRQEIYLRRLHGTSWIGVGGSDAGGGVSRSDTDSYEPRAVVAGDRFCLVWTEPAGEHLQVTMRCHDGWW